MSLAMQRNIGAFISTAIANAAAVVNVTAGAGNNASAITGTVVDLQAYGNPKSCVVSFPIKATLASANTLSLAAYLQSTVDGTNGPWTNVAVLAAAVVKTGISGGAAQYFTADFDVDLQSAKRYVSVVYTLTASNASLDTANVYPPVMIMAGQAELPI